MDRSGPAREPIGRPSRRSPTAACAAQRCPESPTSAGSPAPSATYQLRSKNWIPRLPSDGRSNDTTNSSAIAAAVPRAAIGASTRNPTAPASSRTLRNQRFAASTAWLPAPNAASSSASSAPLPFTSMPRAISIEVIGSIVHTTRIPTTRPCSSCGST
jgi:hypothetical protein